MIVRLFFRTYLGILNEARQALTVTAKGQVPLRGEKITMDKLPDGRIEVKAARPTDKISDTFGLLKSKREGRVLSIEDMNEIVARGWAGKR